jgi:uncharacterized protein (DUF736 family)
MPTDMKGSLSRNAKRETDRHPEFRGSCMVAGVEYWLSAWIREGDDGSKYFSLAFKEKEPKPAPGPQASPQLKAQQNGGRGNYSPRQMLDDEIPF